ncbi:MAG: DNA-processing protein DprA [Gammaproteobacteria bacterium]|nr:DNA-processing protein DprA [Gammaproteobacteria bacterium]
MANGVARSPTGGGARLVKLIERFGGVNAFVAASAPDLRRAGLKDDSVEAIRHFDESLLRQDLEWLKAPGHTLMTWNDERYPSLLRNLSSPPAALFVDGDVDVLWQPQLAVIGSRNPTSGGRDNARDFASELTRQGLTITSGMADGIDSEAHMAALDAGGSTVAVLGTGADVVYPASGRSLARRISERGALVSEFPLGTPARRTHFPSRNRIISGLSMGVLVIEAGLRSGTLITARLAGEQGREIFALPGSIHNPMAKGCHRLIRDGARLVENVSEILQELAALAGRMAVDLQQRNVDDAPQGLESDAGHPKLEDSARGAADGLERAPWESDPDYLALWDCLGYDPRPVDAVIEKCGLTARAVSAMLLMLELRGMVEAHPGGAYSRKKNRGI